MIHIDIRAGVKGRSTMFMVKENASPAAILTVMLRFLDVDPEFRERIEQRKNVAQFEQMPQYGEIWIMDPTAPANDPYVVLARFHVASTGHDYSNDVKTLGQAARSLKQSAPSKPVLTCPTCGSHSVRRIGYAERGVSAGLFGLFSKTARSQFECMSCHYKW